MNITGPNTPARALLLLALTAGIHSAGAGLITLSSPDNRWRLSSDEFGAYGEAAAGSFAQRDFGTGLTGYSWASSLLVSEGATRQWITGTGLGLFSEGLLGAGSLISDSVLGNIRTSAFSLPTITAIRLDLIQTVTDSGITQQYRFTNNRATTANFSVLSFHDVDLDGVTALNDLIAEVGGTMRVSEGGRNVFFSPSSAGYAGYLAGLVPAGGLTFNLDRLGYDNFGIPGAFLNQFRDVSNVGNGGAVGANADLNADKVSDSVADVGYLFQNNISIPAGGSVTLSFGSSAVPEPSSSILCMIALGGFAARRRRS